MSAVTQKKIDHVTRLRILAKQLVDVSRELADARAEYTALGWDADDLSEGCVGGNEGLTGNDMVAIHSTNDALQTWLAQGWATNLYKVTT